MISGLYLPNYPLNRFIESFFYYREFNPVNSYDRLLPDGNVQLIFEFTGDSQYIYDNSTLEELQACRKVWFSGFRTIPITIPSGAGSEMLIVNFKKGKALPFLMEPMHSLKNCVVDGELVLKNDILNLWQIMVNHESYEDKFLILESEFIKYFSQYLFENTYVDYIINNVHANPVKCNLKELELKSGYTQKHIIKMFKDNVGVTPKSLLKNRDFQKSLIL